MTAGTKATSASFIPSSRAAQCITVARTHCAKRKARARDNSTCQHCGAAGVDVHRIRPFRLFTCYVEANDLANLITLCKPCHRRADALVQRAA